MAKENSQESRKKKNRLNKTLFCWRNKNQNRWGVKSQKKAYITINYTEPLLILASADPGCVSTLLFLL